MATLALAAAGAAIGNAAVTGTVLGLTGAAWGWMIGATLGSYLFAPTYRSEGPRLSDMKVSGGGYGVGIPHVYGAARVNGNVIWSSSLIETVNTEEVGGKGGGGTEVTTYSYSVNVAVGVCEGPIDCIRRIWANGKLIYDVTGSVAVDDQVIAAGNLAIYLGSETQTPDPVMQAALGAANVPAHRGLAYVVFEGLQLEKFGNRVPKFDFEIGSGGVAYLGYDNYNEAVAHSTDLVNWVNTYSADGVTINDPYNLLSNGLNKFSMWSDYYNAGTDEYGTRFYTSSDGITWTPGPFSTTIYDLPGYSNAAYMDNRDTNGGKFIQVLEQEVGGTPYPVLESTDGNSWTVAGHVTLTNNTNSLYDIRNFFYSSSAGKYVLMMGAWYLNTDTVIYSGTTLANITEVHRFTEGAGHPGSVSMAGLTELNGTFFALVYVDPYGADQLTIQSSTDLINWTVEFTFPDDGLDLYYATIASSGTRLVVAYHGYDPIADNFFIAARTSSNGSAWSARNVIQTSAASKILSVMTFDGGKFIFSNVYDVPGTNNLFYSTDGETWGITNLNSAVYLDGLFSIVALGSPCGTQPEPLSTAVASLCSRVGLGSNDIDTSQIQDIQVAGYVVSNQMTARAAIEPLLAAYNVDAFESDGKIKFVPKTEGYVGGAIVESELGAASGTEPSSDYVRLTRTQEYELPNEVVVRYADRNLDYDTNQQYARRIAGTGDNVLTLDMPMVLSATEANRLARNVLYRTWVQRDEYSFSTTQKYAAHEPTDIVFVPYGGENRRVRITKKEESGALINWVAVSEDLSVYDQIATGSSGEGSAPAILARAETDLMVFETPVLRDQDDYLQFTVVAGGTTSDAWPGGSLYIVSKDAQPVQVALGALPPRAVTGQLLSSLAPVGDPITSSWDTTNTFSVQIPWGALESRTADEVLAGFNTCVVQRADGTVEVLGFQTATLTAPGTYTLSNLLRRIRQNSSFSGGAVGDKFAMLTQGTTKLIGMQLQDVGAVFEFAGPRYGTAVVDATTELVTLTGMSKKPLSPIGVTGSRDGLDNLTIQWTRRTRIGGTWATGENGPVSEATEAYEIDILSNASPPVVLRTLTSSTPTVTYTIADQITDFGSPAPATVDVQIYQMSAFIGRGYPAAATV